jgi:hypothetical protein
MDLEENDIEFEQLLQDKRHKELLGTLKGIASLLSKDNSNDSGIISAIEKQSGKIEKFVQVIKELPQPKVNVEVNNDNVQTSITEMANSILGSLNEIKKVLQQPEKEIKKEWTFDITRNVNGFINSITAKQK